MPGEDTPVNQAAFKSKFRDEPMPVKGRRFIVTGGTTGIGRATAMLLVARAARVFTFGRHQKELDDTLADIQSIGGGAIAGTAADVTRPEDIERAFRAADATLGGLDGVVCNAGMAAQSVLEQEPAVWREALDTNLLAYMYCARFALDRMRPRKDGHVVFVGSMSAKARDAGSDVYVATKMGVRGFADSLAKSVNPEGIRVTLVEPGLVGADMTANKHPPEKVPQEEAELKILRAEELAHMIVYCLEQPRRCDVAMVQIRPTNQPL